MATLNGWRVANWDTPFWIGPNREASRFNALGEGPVQYWSLHPLTPLAEYLRGQGIAGVERLLELRLRLWVASFDVQIETIGFDNASDHGLEPEDLISDDYSACHAFGSACLAGNGPQAIDVPSAALPGTRNLVLFGPLVASPFNVQPVDDVDAPTTVAAEGAHPLEGLLTHVRHVGGPHPEFHAWSADQAHQFVEPPTPLPGS
jgi:RES domain-containing protein